MSRSRNVWEKFDIEEYKLARHASAAPGPNMVENPRPDTSRWRWKQSRSFRAGLSWFATLFWLYVLLKLFVSDIDRWIVASVSPSWVWILDFRFFILLTVVTILVLVARWWQISAILLYVWFFPW